MFTMIDKNTIKTKLGWAVYQIRTFWVEFKLEFKSECENVFWISGWFNCVPNNPCEKPIKKRKLKVYMFLTQFKCRIQKPPSLKFGPWSSRCSFIFSSIILGQISGDGKSRRWLEKSKIFKRSTEKRTMVWYARI